MVSTDFYKYCKACEIDYPIYKTVACFVICNSKVVVLLTMISHYSFNQVKRRTLLQDYLNVSDLPTTTFLKLINDILYLIVNK